MGGGEHGPAFLLETNRKKTPKNQTSPEPPLCQRGLFHPSIPPGACSWEQDTGSPLLLESLRVAPCLPSRVLRGASQHPPRQRWVLAMGTEHPRRGRAL